MKKFLALCLSLTLLVTACTFFCMAAETDTTVKYGKADLSLTLIDPFDETQELPGFMNWGNGWMENGHIYMECAGGSLYDIYAMTTAALQDNATLGGHTHMVLAVKNTSDGDIFFGIQPDVLYEGAAIHAYLSSELARANPVKLVSTDGTVKDAAFWNQRSAGREVFLIPYEFEGYVIIPHAILATDIESQTAVSPDGKLEYTGLGLHALPDDASYLELTITAAYACSSLPAYEAPETQPETQPETVPETTPETSAPAESGSTADTTADSTASTEPDSPDETPADTTGAPDTTAPTTQASPAGGCSASVSAALLLVAVAAGAMLTHRRKD